MGKIRNILVVCTGNSCRSPMAEGFFKKFLRPEGAFEITSASTAGLSGLHPTPEAIEVMREEGIDISLHASNAFSAELAERADLILAMANAHKSFILQNTPEAKNKVYLLKEFAGVVDENNEIDDPIGHTIDIYRRIKDEIKNAVENSVIKIQRGE